MVLLVSKELLAEQVHLDNQVDLVNKEHRE